MQHKLIGDHYPVLECTLNDGESMVCEAGAMVWMTDNLTMESTAGGIGGMFKKLISGESLFQNIYTANGAAKIAFGGGFAGTILPFNLDGTRTLIMQKGTFLASESSIKLDIAFQKKLKSAFFGGDGFVMQSVTGSGWVFFEADGDIHEVDLADGEVLMVDTNNLVGYESSVTMDVVTVGGLKNKIAGGEGLFNTKLTGPGKVWLQTMSVRALIASMLPVSR